MSAFKNFLITFLIAAVIFGITGYFTANYVSGVVTGILHGEDDKLGAIKSGDKEPNVSGNETEDNYTGPLPDGESFTYLFVGTDYRPEVHNDYCRSLEELQKLISDAGKDSSVGILSSKVRYINSTWMVLVRADKEKHEFAFCYITPETMVTTPAGEKSLGETYGMYGIDVLCEYISYMTGLSIDRTVIIDAAGLSDFIEKLGEVEFDLTTEIFFTGDEYVSSPVRRELKKEKDADKGSDKDDKNTSENESIGNTEGGEPDGGVYEEVENESALTVGTHDLSDNSIYIINVFKEYSSGDIEFKNSYIVELLRGYFEKYAELTEDEAIEKLVELTDGNMYSSADPYEEKETVAVELTEDDVKNFHSMIQAVDYFNIREIMYPGYYGIPDGEDSGHYYPNVEEGLSMFSKYRAE